MKPPLPLLLLAMTPPLHAATVTMTGEKSVAPQRHDGALRPVVGVQEHALFRPTNNESAAAAALDGHAVVATRFNHHPFLTYWNKRFWAYFIGMQIDEKTKAGYLQWSDDGRTWTDENKATIFPAPLASHQRFAFYIAANGRLLVSTWHSPGGEHGRGGIGSRLVREIKGPGDFGPIFVLKPNAAGPAPKLDFKPYTDSPDAGFREACGELLGNALAMQQMWEEDADLSPTAPYVIPGRGNNSDFEGKAFAWYRLDGPDGRIVGNWKGGWVGLSSGSTWEKGAVTLDQSNDRFNEHRSAKMWGEPRAGGGYALFYTMGTDVTPPATFPDSRTPLVVAGSADGLTFTEGAHLISGDSGPQLYRNALVDNKTVGGSYVRGIPEIANREGKPRPNDNLWITYSTNKEYVWVTEVPADLSVVETKPVNDRFADWKPGDRVGRWNIRNGGWSSVRLVKDGDGGTVLRLRDKDPYDYAKAFRVFPASSEATITTGIVPRQAGGGELHVELVDATGKRPVRLRLSDDGGIHRQDPAGTWRKIGAYQPLVPMELTITFDSPAGTWSVFRDGVALAENLPVAETVDRVERVEYRTGPWRLDDFRTNAYGGGTPGMRATDLPGAHDPVPMVEFDVTGLQTRSGAASAAKSE